MTDVKKKERDRNVDVLRGLAMLLVVLGHTMTGSTVNSYDSFLFQIIWSLQMPLFVLISGYVTRYSSTLELEKYIKRKTIAYLIPWGVWTFAVRGLILQQTNYLNIRWLLWHMDSGYWFLFTIWTISVIFGISQYIAGKFEVNGRFTKEIIIEFIVYVIAMGLVAGIGQWLGWAFLGIKLTIYYMPFYFLGFVFGKCQNKTQSIEGISLWSDLVVAICLVVWLVIITRINLYNINDSGLGILIRIIASITGCVAIIGLVGMKDSFFIRLGGGGSARIQWGYIQATICS